MTSATAPNRRLRWDQSPAAVRSWIEQVLGEPVIEALSQSGGFSPGTADRLTGVSGRRLFAKSVSRELNSRAFELFRAEAAVWATLGGLDLPAPAFRGVAEHKDWITLAFDDIAGREPGFDDGDIAAVFGALDALPDGADRLSFPPSPGAAGRSASARVAAWAAHWPALLDDGQALLPDRLHSRRAELAALAAGAEDAAAGTRLAHLDLRPDNVVLDADGRVWLVDWPWAGTGAPWFDALSYLTGLATSRPLAELDAWTSRPGSPLAAASPGAIDAALAAQGGALLVQASRPSRLAGLTELQREFGLRLLDWVALRRSW